MSSILIANCQMAAIGAIQAMHTTQAYLCQYVNQPSTLSMNGLFLPELVMAWIEAWLLRAIHNLPWSV